MSRLKCCTHITVELESSWGKMIWGAGQWSMPLGDINQFLIKHTINKLKILFIVSFVVCLPHRWDGMMTQIEEWLKRISVSVRWLGRRVLMHSRTLFMFMFCLHFYHFLIDSNWFHLISRQTADTYSWDSSSSFMPLFILINWQMWREPKKCF